MEAEENHREIPAHGGASLRVFRKPILCLAMTLLSGRHSSAQDPGVDHSGYAITIPMFRSHVCATLTDRPSGRDGILELTRLRSRPSLFLGRDFSLFIEYELTALYDGRQAAISSQAGTPRRQIANLRWATVSGEHLSITHFIDRLFLRWERPATAFTVGRQRISWGTGRVWNPTDLFNPINPANFEKIEKDGVDAVSVKHFFTDFTDLELVWNPEDRFRSWNAGWRFRTNFGEVDISVMGGRFDGRVVLGGDLAGNFFSAGIRGEVLYSGAGSSSSPAVEIIAGIDHQVSGELYVLAEYLYNGEGSDTPGGYDPAAIAEGRGLQMGIHYLFLRATHLLHPLVSGSLGMATNMIDGSGFLLPRATYSASPNMDVEAGGLLPYGGCGSEYRFYPNSVFLRSTIYF